ncbi:hypothetical protein BH10ACT3_BH10ACT3_19230 [soil metagenome]
MTADTDRPDPTGTGAEAPTTDGRVQRGERTRAAIVAALLEKLNDGAYNPTAQEIATAAGVSVRSIFQHFDDMEALFGELVRAQAERVQPLIEAIDADGSFEQRLDAIASQRSTLYERITPIRRAIGNRVHSSPAIASRLSALAAILRQQTATQFAPELDRLAAADHPDQVLDAVELLWSYDAWERLRSTQSLSVDQAVATLRLATARVLG